MKSRGLNFLLAVVVVLSALGLIAALSGCAGPSTIRGSVSLPENAPKRILGVPSKGHWAEESGFPIITYVVRGDDCTFQASATHQVTDDHGKFDLGRDESLCAMPLRKGEKVIFHGEWK